MKLSQRTLSILKNYAGINNSILIEPGQILKTSSLTRNLKSQAPIVEEFGVDVAIYDLSQFLSYVSLFRDPDFDFQEHYVVISEDNNKLTYMYSDINCLFANVKNQNSSDFLSFFKKKLKMSNPTVSFPFSETEFSVLKAAQVMKLSELSITGSGDKVTFQVLDSNNSSLGTYSSEIDVESVIDFHCLVDLNYFQVLKSDYTLSLSKNTLRLAREDGLEYYIVLSKAEYNS